MRQGSSSGPNRPRPNFLLHVTTTQTSREKQTASSLGGQMPGTERAKQRFLQKAGYIIIAVDPKTRQVWSTF